MVGVQQNEATPLVYAIKVASLGSAGFMFDFNGIRRIKISFQMVVVA